MRPRGSGLCAVLLALLLLLGQMPAAAAPSPDIERRVQQYLSWQKGRWGLYAIDLRTGREYGVHADRPFAAASTFKLPLALFICEQVAQGRLSITEQISYTKADYDPGEGVLHGLRAGEALSVAYLVDVMLRESDNIARNMLLRRVGREAFWEYVGRLGIPRRELDPQTPLTTPREMARLMLHLHDGGCGDEELTGWLLELLATTRFPTRIPQGVPKGTWVAHKVGTRPGMVHDVGLVSAAEAGFIVAIFSADVEAKQAERVIAEVTRLLWTGLRTGRMSPTPSFGPGSRID